MKATSTDVLPVGPLWAYEIKWDGVRTIAFAGPDGLRLQSRSLRDVTAQYPEVAGVGGLGEGTVLDGEIVAFDEDGRPSFERLQSRINLASRLDVVRRQGEIPVVFMVFDLLRLDGRDLTAEPYSDRRRQLEDLAANAASIQVPRHHVGDGPALLEATRQQGLEGLVAKRVDSPYLPGRRTRTWLKVKNFRRQELVVGGWLPGQGGRSGRIGALLVGHYEDGRLRFAGRVGTGFDDAELARLDSRLAPLVRPDCPFVPEPPALVRRSARWVDPVVVVEVAFSEWTSGGTLRAPSYKGEHSDRDAAAVRREP